MTSVSHTNVPARAPVHPSMEKVSTAARETLSPIQLMKHIPTMQLFASPYCNLKCPYCSQGRYRKPTLAEDFLSNEVLLECLKSWPPTHFYISGGEPLHHPGLKRFLEQAAESRHYVSFDTNGVVPNDTISEVLDAFPHERFGFFNISHHLLAGVKLDHIAPMILRLKQAGIPHFVKYIGVPESIPVIREHMQALQQERIGVAVTLLETYAQPWRGRRFPQDYTDDELLELLNLVTLNVHGLQLFGGIESKSLPCTAGYRYFTLNMRNQRELCACCHRSDVVDWRQTVFSPATAQAKVHPCETSKCLGDLMFIIGCQGLGDEIDRFEQVCRGIASPVGMESVLRFTKAIAKQRRLVLQERFDATWRRFHIEGEGDREDVPCEVVAFSTASPGHGTLLSAVGGDASDTITIREYDTEVSVDTLPPDPQGWTRQWHGMYMLTESFSQESWQSYLRVFKGDSYHPYALEAFSLISILRQYRGLNRFNFVELGSGRSDWCLAVASMVRNHLFETEINDYFTLAVEAEPHHYIWSAVHFLKQDVQGQVVHGAVGKSRGVCRFKADTDPAGHMGQAVRPDGNITVECYTLEDLMRDHGLTRVHAVHMDIQGEEVNAVIGARRVLPSIDFFIIGTHASCLEVELKQVLADTHQLVCELPRMGQLSLPGIPRPFVSNDDGVQVYQRKVFGRKT